MELFVITFIWALLGASGSIVLTRKYRHVRAHELCECILFGAFFGAFSWLAVMVDAIHCSDRIIIRRKGS